MKALICTKITPPDGLEWMDLEIPKPSEMQILIKIMALGVNFRDTLIIEDKYQFKPNRPFSPGGEIVGIVEKIGENVHNLQIGDAVFGEIGHGGLAEYVIANASDCYKLPKDIDFTAAASLIVNYGTAYYGLKHKAKAVSGETLLVTGASGGTGLAAVQVGKAMGLNVIAAASSDDKVQIAQASGADNGFAYPRLENNDENRKIIRDMFREKLGENRPDVIFDTIGGGYAEGALRCINWGGRFLVVGFTSGIPSIPLNLPLVKACDIMGVFFTSYAEKFRAEFENDLEQIFQWLRAGKIKLQINKIYDFPDAISALNSLKGQNNHGKTIVKIGQY